MNKMKMDKTTKALAAGAALLCGSVLADAESGEEWNYTPGEGVSFGEQPVVKGEFGVKFDSRYMTYGVIDGKDPIVTPGAKLTFADLVHIGADAIFDTTKGNGKRGEYGNRAGKYTTLDMAAGVAQEFDLGERLGKLSADFYYIYEYIPRHDGSMDDTQYLNLELSLDDLLLEPAFWFERDLMADDGTYVFFGVGHTFALVDGATAEDDPVLTFKPSVGQGFGDKKRVRGYGMGDDHGGVMDTTLKGELEWKLCECLKLGAYIAYSDFWFDRKMRDGARDHNGAWGSSCDRSWNVYGGIGLTATF